MSRDLTAAMAAEIVKPVVRPALLFDATLADNSVIYYWTGLGNISWNGQPYIGVGGLISVGPVDETDDVKAQGAAVQVNGVPSTMVSLFLASLGNGKQGIVRLAMRDSSGAVVDAPRVLFRGRLDGAEINESNVEQPVGTLTYEHELVDLERPREWRYTDEHQKRFFSGDRGLEHIAALQDVEIPFGNKHRV